MKENKNFFPLFPSRAFFHFLFKQNSIKLLSDIAMKMLDIVEIVLASRENGNITYDIKLNEKKIGDITIMEKGIENIWIAENYRCKGYGTMLLNHVEWIIKIACYPQIEVEAVGTDAAPFFKKNGYVLSEDECGEYRGYKKLK